MDSGTRPRVLLPDLRVVGPNGLSGHRYAYLWFDAPRIEPAPMNVDQFKPAYRMLVVACKSDKRWFDLDAVRTTTDVTRPGGLRQGTPHGTDERRAALGEVANMTAANPAGAPPLDYWLIDESEPLTTEGTNMGEARYIIGDVFDALATLEPNSVDLVFSSPPFLALRSYLPADHPDKAKEIGSEATPADFLDTLLDVVEACDRVLAPHGSLCFELGDTFAGSGGAGGDYAEGGLRDGQPKADGSQSRAHPRFRAGYLRDDGRVTAQSVDLPDTWEPRPSGGMGWPLPKSLCGIPTLFAWSLAYGRNLLRPERETPRWRIRNLIVWARPNPPVGALGDKFRPATSYLTVACKSDKRWFDLDAVRSEHQASDTRGEVRYPRQMKGRVGTDGENNPSASGNNPAGAPPLDYWEIPTQPYPGSHYATMPAALIVKPVAAMCPAKVCRLCGEPSRRIVESERTVDLVKVTSSEQAIGRDVRGPGRNMRDTSWGSRTTGVGTTYETLGWTDCNHNDWRAGVVLDPFAGSGTTVAVATGHGRDAIGIDLDARNFELARQRVGPMFLPEPEYVGEPFQFPKVEDVQTDAEVL